ncbi:MAG: glycine--tRNA ligase subunit beta [Actinomycetia bacterium]|nr:glycine--tRNA ligase subunit beta [Actinomycetes bacterium]
MPTLLFEIGCEELPASTCRAVSDQLPGLVEEHLGAAPTEVLVGPRRLAALVELPAEVQTPAVTGPPEAIAFGGDGQPTKAALGFARKVGVNVAALELHDGFLTFRPPATPTAAFAEQALPAIISGIVIEKPMVWDATRIAFSRPIRWLCAKLDEATLDVSLGEVQSASASFGHRFTSGSIEIASPRAYTATLRTHDVEPDAQARRAQIIHGLDRLGAWRDPAGVLDEVVHLVEHVVVLEGTFDEKYLELPERVIETAMQSHQRYFPLGGRRFAFVANGGDPATVRAGNERVLAGRLEDAAFTYERDVRAGIDELAARLGTITFVAPVGSFMAKSERLVKLVSELDSDEDARTGARLAKADQAAELVREFPDLEGYIGAQYAQRAGYPDAVATAIDEHYRPDSAGGPLPTTPAARALAAAEKIDNLTVAFGISQRPTGSRDPYGLRRAAIGLCRLATEGGLSLDVHALVTRAYELLAAQQARLTEEQAAVSAQVVDFVEERLETLLGVPVDYVRAARASSVGDLGRKASLARTLADLEPARLERLHTVYVRADRIVSKAGSDDLLPPLRTELLSEAAELAVAEAHAEIVRDLADVTDFEAAVAAVEGLAEPLERFFDEVLVMDENSAVRLNRLRLLADLRGTVRTALGDLAEIPL